MHIKYQDYNAEVVFVPYLTNGNTALQLCDVETMESITMATANTHIKVDPNIVLLKTWSYNTGIAEELIKAGVIKEQHVIEIPSGFEIIYGYELTPRAEKERQRQYEVNEYDSIRF